MSTLHTLILARYQSNMFTFIYMFELLWYTVIFHNLKPIYNIDTLWVLCGKRLIPQLYDCHILLHSYSVKVDGDWIVLKSGNEIDFQALGIYSIDNNVYVTLIHSF